MFNVGLLRVKSYYQIINTNDSI